ncbi:unnamed protein product [Orchesella dallaii]|uniref:EGF-like domain-containing protein n=1 Tax=Orchesella dallaii TaxID=48710 RepID=A0ABP1SA99_9HEXA
MERRFLTGDNQGVLQLQMVVAYGRNRPTIINTLAVEEQHKLLSAREHTLIRVPLHSFKITEQKITAAHFIDHIEDRPATDVLTEVSQIMFQSASQMVEFTKQGEEVTSSEQVDSLPRASADSSSRLLRASYSLGSSFSTTQPNFQMFNKRDVYDYHTDDNIGRDYYFEVQDIEDDFHQEGFNEISENLANEDVKKYAKVSHHSLFAFERVMDAAVENLGYQADFYTNTDKAGLHAEVLPKLAADYTAATRIADGTKTEVMIPKDLHDILKDKVDNQLVKRICSNHGTCQPSPTDDDTAFCRCELGYSGEECENGETAATGLQGRSHPRNVDPNHVDPCAAAPCQNGGTCLLGDCSYPDEYIGQHCEYIDACTAIPCQNGGTCSLKHPDPNTKPTQTCTCADEYIGEHCQIVNPCYMESSTSTDLVPIECNKEIARWWLMERNSYATAHLGFGLNNVTSLIYVRLLRMEVLSHQISLATVEPVLTQALK